MLSDLKPAGDGIYKGRAFEPKRDISGSATVRQVGPDVMIVKGCAVMGLFCKAQRWTRDQLSATPSARDLAAPAPPPGARPFRRPNSGRR